MSEARKGKPGTRAVEGRTEIDAPPERVWRALTEAAELERWFPLEARVEAGEGGTVYMSWKNEYAGTSRILRWDAPRHLRTSWGGAEDGEHAQVTDYFVESEDGKRTVVRVVTSGFPTDAAWDDWVEGTRLGWRYQLASLKHYLEHHDGVERRVVYLRRRVSLPPEEAWERLFGSNGLERDVLAEADPIDVIAPRQLTAVMTDPPDALLRISLEPCQHDVEGKDVTFFLSAWGDHGKRLRALEKKYAKRLEELFPEGKTIE